MFKVRKYYLGMAIYNFSFKQVHKYTRLRKQKLDYFVCTNKYLLEIWWSECDDQPSFDHFWIT